MIAILEKFKVLQNQNLNKKKLGFFELKLYSIN